MSFTVSVTGIESIDEDFKRFLADTNTKLAQAIALMEAPLTGDLFRHIEEDVYEAYRPKTYPRRRDHSGFGIALNDMDHNVFFWPHEDGFALDYRPDGSHSGTTADLDPGSEYYDADNPKDIKPDPVHGDDLIRRIETGKGYDWDCYPGRRPFWENFVNEELDGELARHLLNAMRTSGIEDLKGDWGDIVRENGDGEY